jgi:hypothetical protein
MLDYLKDNAVVEKYAPEFARLAVGNGTSSVKFCKYSVQGHLLDLHQRTQAFKSQVKRQLRKIHPKEKYLLLKKTIENPLQVFMNVIVEKLVEDPFNSGSALTIQTSKGDIPVQGAKIILCGGVFPTSTLLLNSFPNHPFNNFTGKRVSGHFQSHITARIPKALYAGSYLENKLNLGAFYLPGFTEEYGSFHVQVSVIQTDDPTRDA